MKECDDCIQNKFYTETIHFMEWMWENHKDIIDEWNKTKEK